MDLHSTVDELDSERLLYAATIDRLLVGTAILDEAGKVMRSNQAAQRLFAARDGLECRQERLFA